MFAAGASVTCCFGAMYLVFGHLGRQKPPTMAGRWRRSSFHEMKGGRGAAGPGELVGRCLGGPRAPCPKTIPPQPSFSSPSARLTGSLRSRRSSTGRPCCPPLVLSAARADGPSPSCARADEDLSSPCRRAASGRDYARPFFVRPPCPSCCPSSSGRQSSRGSPTATEVSTIGVALHGDAGPLSSTGVSPWGTGSCRRSSRTASLTGAHSHHHRGGDRHGPGRLDAIGFSRGPGSSRS